MTPGVAQGSGVEASHSRFHAIISATPMSGGLSSLPPRAVPASYSPSSSGTDHHVNKRRKTVYDGKGFAEALKNADKNESAASRQRPQKYQSKELLFSALRVVFKQGGHVDFHGSFDEKLSESANAPHKTRVQSLTVDIWKATGYRFTVKDHPRISNGHKTRFWCSQDEAHRSKSSKLARLPNSTSKPRISSAGEALAKTRFACRSRLLISSRDADSAKGVRTITVRMHHHIAHEPYVDNNIPPEIAQTIYADFGWSSVEGMPITPLSSSRLESGADVMAYLREGDEDGEGDIDGEGEGEGEAGKDDDQVEDDIDAEAEDESQSQPFEPMPVSMNVSVDSRHHPGYGHDQGTSYQHNAQLQPVVTATTMNTTTIPAPKPMTGPSLSTSSIATTASSSNSHHGSAPATFVDLRQVSPSNQLHQQHHQTHRHQTTQGGISVQTIPTPPLSAGSSSGSHYSHGHGGHQGHALSQYQAHTTSTNQYHTPHHSHTQHHHSPHLSHQHHSQHHHQHRQHHQQHQQHQQHQHHQRQVHSSGSNGTSLPALSATINQRLSTATTHIQPYNGTHHHSSILHTSASHHTSSTNVNNGAGASGSATTNTTASPHHSNHSALPSMATNSHTAISAAAAANSLLTPLSQHSQRPHSHLQIHHHTSSPPSSTQPPTYSSSSAQSISTQSSSSSSTTILAPQSMEYHKRMLEHISTIREFCAGLEYQLQFNDYRMLDQLERDGEGFLKLARECLRKEGRWDGTL